MTLRRMEGYPAQGGLCAASRNGTWSFVKSTIDSNGHVREPARYRIVQGLRECLSAADAYTSPDPNNCGAGGGL
jgi:hypothetical protein